MLLRRAAGVSRRLATVATTTNGINRVLMHAVVLPLAPVLAAASRGRKPTESTVIMRRFLIVSGSLRSRLAVICFLAPERKLRRTTQAARRKPILLPPRLRRGLLIVQVDVCSRTGAEAPPQDPRPKTQDLWSGSSGAGSASRTAVTCCRRVAQAATATRCETAPGLRDPEAKAAAAGDPRGGRPRFFAPAPSPGGSSPRCAAR